MFKLLVVMVLQPGDIRKAIEQNIDRKVVNGTHGGWKGTWVDWLNMGNVKLVVGGNKQS